jgi:hypothetical protein
MKHLRFVFLLIVISLAVFYLAACLITGTVWVTEMPEIVRRIVFGIWLGVDVLAMFCYSLFTVSKNKPN